MTETKLYTCDICHTSYKDKAVCEQCEISHVTNYEKIDFKYINNKGVKNYPTKIIVTFNDGHIGTYSR